MLWFRQNYLLILIIISIVIIWFGYTSKSTNVNNSISPNQKEQSVNQISSNQAGEDSDSVNYNGNDLVNLRTQCADLSQNGFKKFVQSQQKINNQAVISDYKYNIGPFHFNQRLGKCLVVVYSDFTSTSGEPSETSDLVNIYENKSIMQETSYGNPADKWISYDDKGHLISQIDWYTLYNKYMTE